MDAIHKALEAGLPDAYLFMGIKYCYGNGIAQDLKKGKACLKKAIDLRVTDAYSVMGNVLALIEKNENEALKYWEKGTQFGSGSCAYSLGMIIIHTDFPKGVELLRKAYEKNIKRWNVVSTDPLAPLYTYVCRIGTESFEVDSQNSNKPEVEEITEAYIVKFGKGISQEQFNQIKYSKI